MKRRLIIFPALIIALGFISMQGLLAMRSEPTRRTPQPRPKVVESRIAELDSVATYITVLGRVVSTQPVALYSEVAGTLQSGDIDFLPAQSFKRGDLIVKIDDRSIKFEINSAKSDLLTALAAVLPEIKLRFPEEYDQWQNFFESMDFDSDLQSLPGTNNPQIKLYLSRYNVYKLYFRVRDLEITLSKHYKYAPFDGTISITNLRVGSTTGPGALLGNILNLEKLEVKVPIPSAELSWIDFSKKVVFKSFEFPGEWIGTIVRVGSTIDENTQTVPVYIRLDQTDNKSLLNGAYLEAKIPGTTVAKGIRLPRKALYNGSLIYMVDNGKIISRRVEIARYETESVLISSGIDSGDTVVVELLQGIIPEMPAIARVIDESQPEAE